MLHLANHLGILFFKLQLEIIYQLTRCLSFFLHLGFQKVNFKLARGRRFCGSWNIFRWKWLLRSFPLGKLRRGNLLILQKYILAQTIVFYFVLLYFLLWNPANINKVLLKFMDKFFELTGIFLLNVTEWVDWWTIKQVFAVFCHADLLNI